MNKYQDQLENNRAKDIREFLVSSEFSGIRVLYKTNFERIVGLIEKFGNSPAIEDIANMGDGRLRERVYAHLVFLRQINNAIKDRDLTLEDF
jgi:hypothetical protein